MKYECFDCSSIFDIDRSNDGGCPSCGSFNVSQYDNDYDRYGDDEEDGDEYDLTCGSDGMAYMLVLETKF